MRAIALCDPENNHMDEGAIAMTKSTSFFLFKLRKTHPWKNGSFCLLQLKLVFSFIHLGCWCQQTECSSDSSLHGYSKHHKCFPVTLSFFLLFQFCGIENLASFSKNKKGINISQNSVQICQGNLATNSVQICLSQNHSGSWTWL